MKKILFISHDATRTGAPILLLRLIEQIKLSGNFEIFILLKDGGELKEDFERLGRTVVWNCKLTDDSFTSCLKSKAYNSIGIKTITKEEKYKFKLAEQFKEVDIIFNNTVTNASLLKQLPLEGKKVFSYFHELQVITEMFAKHDEVKYLEHVSDKIFVPSVAVKQYLMENFHLAPAKIAILKYIIPAPKIEKELQNRDLKSRNNTFLVGFGGTLHWRKGYEFLPLIGKKIIIDNQIRDIHFVWIGANIHSNEFIILKNDLIKLNLFEFFTFIEPSKNIENSLSQLDIFVLPSREDAFPLIVLEAAYHQVPCVYFSNGGGIGEFSGDDAGIQVDYLDIEAMSQKIIELKKNNELKRRLGRRAKEKIIEYSQSQEVIGEILPFLSYSEH